MFRFSLRKMFKNRWLTLSLFIGYLMAVAIVASMPIYSHAILDRMLQKDLQQIQVTSNVYPGWVSSQAGLNTGGAKATARADNLRIYNTVYHETVLADIDLPIQEDILVTALTGTRISRRGSNASAGEAVPGGIAACENLFDHVTLLAGEFPSNQMQGDALEVIISEVAARKLQLSMGSEYTLNKYSLADGRNEYIDIANVKVVGVFKPTDPGELFWGIRLDTFDSLMIADHELFREQFIDAEVPQVNQAIWGTALDYTVITPESAAVIAEKVYYYNTSKVFAPPLDTKFYDVLEDYAERRADLTATLWVIEVPILLMLLLYIFMVSRLILDHEKNEIAVLRSRGAKKSQVTLIYLVQALCLAVIAFAAGPFLSLMFCRMIGASNGFMEFVSRASLPVKLTREAIVYAAVTAGVLVLTMLIAVVSGKESSIVNFKRKKSGKSDVTLWEKLCLDLVCLAVSLYGLYNFRNRMAIIEETGAAASDVPIDFLLYGSSTLFILGTTLLCLRLFPLIIKLIYRIGQRFWGPVLYMSLLNISRSARKNQMISLFLVFTLSMGVFNAVTVRTLNRNEEDRINYTVGADVVLQESWPYTGEGENVYYSEPRFEKYEEMATVENAARVLTMTKTTVISNSKSVPNVTVMGIVPNEFGEVCWFRNGLQAHHINEYLNLLVLDPRAILLSQSAMEEFGVNPGDTVYLNIPGNKNTIQCIVYAGIDYFPGFNVKGTEWNLNPSLVVANLTYLQEEMKLVPYAVWLEKADGVTSAELYEELTANEIRITRLDDALAKVTEQKNDPLDQGINGFFTLSFIVTMLITFVGFFIYWILAIKGRLLQFGLLRSMGLSRMSVMLVLLWEQILVSVTAIIAGLCLGTLTAQLYAPVLESNVDPMEQILPFLVSASPVDYWRIIAIVGIMMAIAAVVLGRIIFQLKAGEALKLGED